MASWFSVSAMILHYSLKSEKTKYSPDYFSLEFSYDRVCSTKFNVGYCLVKYGLLYFSKLKVLTCLVTRSAYASNCERSCWFTRCFYPTVFYRPRVWTQVLHAVLGRLPDHQNHRRRNGTGNPLRLFLGY